MVRKPTKIIHHTTLHSSTGSLNPSPGDLAAVESSKGKGGGGNVGGLLDLNIAGAQDDLDMAGVALVGVDTTMGTVCAAAGFLLHKTVMSYAVDQMAQVQTHWGLLNNNALDGEVLNINALAVGVGFGILQEAGDELHRLHGPATYNECVM